MKIIDINGREREAKKVWLDPSWPGYASAEIQSRRDPAQTHTEWYPIDRFLVLNPSLTHLKANKNSAPPPEITGVVGSSTKDSLTDKSQNWLKNVYASYFIWISRGKGEGQTRIVLSNTKNKLTIDKPWDTKPDETSQYTVVLHLGSTDQKGNTLPSVEMAELEEKGRKLAEKQMVKVPPRQYSTEKKQ